MGRNISIQYGLITIAAKAETATDKPLSFNNVCVGQTDDQAHDPLAVKAPSVCTSCGPIVDRDRLKKGLKSGQTFVVFDGDSIAEAKETYATEHKGKITLVPHPSAEFLTATAVGDSLSYLVPDAASADHYQLLVRLITEHPELSFVGLHTPQSATSLYRVAVRDGVLVLEKRVREQSMKPTPSVGGTVNEALYPMLEATLDAFVTPYAADAYEDHYANTVASILAAGEQVALEQAEPLPAKPSDEALMAQLQALRESL